jgi:hypothetical protein
MRARNALVVVVCVSIVAVIAAAHAQPSIPAGATGIPQAGGLGAAVQPPTTATAKPVDPVLRDPILLRNCQAEYDQAMKFLGSSGPAATSNAQSSAQQMGGSIQPQAQMAGKPMGSDPASLAAEAARLEVLRNRALLNKLECKTDQANRKLDYVLNVNVPRR